MPLRSIIGLVGHESSFLATGSAVTFLSPSAVWSEFRPFLYLHLDTNDDSLHRFHWAGACRTFNLLQFLPRSYWLCSTETDPLNLTLPESASIPSVDEWDEPMIFMHEKVLTIAKHLRDESIRSPEVGWEIMKDGQVAAQLELCWTNAKVGIFLEELPESLSQWLQGEGWTLFSLEEAEMQRDRLRAALNRGEIE